MSDNPTKEALSDLLDHVESLETQAGAILRFMRDNGMLTDEKLAPYMEKAAVASDIKARAARARLEYLFAVDDKAGSATEAAPANLQKVERGKNEPGQQASEGPQPKAAEPKADQQSRRPFDTSDKRPTPSQSEPSEVVSARENAKETASSAVGKQKNPLQNQGGSGGAKKEENAA